MDDDKLKIELTGNPFVDTGIGVIASLAKLNEVNQLTLVDIKSVYGDGSQLTEWNSKLKTFSQVFGTNNPLFHPSYGFKKGLGPSDINKRIYKSTLDGLLFEIKKSENGSRCWACGNRTDFDFAQVCKKAVEANGKKAPEEKWVGRDWFPLAGSLGSDAQALPAASRPPHICPQCLFAIHYLPMGLILLDGRLAVFQCSSPEFWYELIKDIVNEIKERVHAGIYDTLGGKEGSRAVMQRLLKLFERLQREKYYYGRVPEGIALYVWRFSNSGASPECLIEEIPNLALTFLWEAAQNNLSSEIESLVGSEGKNPRYSLFQCILNGRDYPNLYPEGKRKGASPKLFALYQMHIRNHSTRALQVAYELAKEISEQVSAKELKRIQRPEAFNEEMVRNQFKAYMVRMTEKGDFALEDYIDLFPLKNGGGITVEWNGWNFIRFYLYHTNEDFPRIDEKNQIINKSNPQLFYYAGLIYNRYLRDKGKDRFQKDVLAQIDRRIRALWLRSQFVQLAESEDGFTYGHWSKLCKLDDERLFISELLFHMRLLWTQWIYENKTSVNITTQPSDTESTDELPERIKTLIELLFTDYVNRRGLDRFYRDILLRLRRKEVGLFWFKDKLTKQVSEEIQPLTEEEWEKFLVNDEGQSIKTERLFQLHLALANIYRVKVFEENLRR
ncbi:MAG: hypothetical protein WCE94_11950 [Candidatus Methanoperedens sp.]